MERAHRVAQTLKKCTYSAKSWRSSVMGDRDGGSLPVSPPRDERSCSRSRIH